MLRVDIAGAQSKISETEALTSGRVGLQCSFSFDDAWDGLQKIAVFEAGDTARDVAMISDTVTVPHEVMANDGVSLHVGVCGKLADGTIVIPTVWANFGRIVSGALPSGQGGTDPTPDVVTQILEAANTAVKTADEALASSSAATADIADLFATKAPAIINTASGEIASFSDGADGMPVKKLEVAINPVQAGSGEPSPENVRPISGWTEVKVCVKTGYDPASNPTIIIQLGQTVYGGTLNVTTGALTATRVLKTFTGDEPFILSQQTRRFTNTYAALGMPAPKFTNASENASKSIFSHGTYRFGSTTSSPFGGYRLLEQTVNFYDVNSAFATADEFKSYLSDNYEAGTPWQLCYELPAPIEIQLDPVSISTLKGINNVWADTGEITEIEYRADTKIYIDQKIAAAVAAMSEWHSGSY